MNGAQPGTLSSQAGGQVNLSGRLDFANVPGLWKQLQPLIKPHAALTLDLNQVEFADSAALALLLQAREEAAQQSARLALQNIPQDLMDLASLSNIDPLLVSTT